MVEIGNFQDRLLSEEPDVIGTNGRRVLSLLAGLYQTILVTALVDEHCLLVLYVMLQIKLVTNIQICPTSLDCFFKCFNDTS